MKDLRYRRLMELLPPQQLITPPHYHFVYSRLFACTIDVWLEESAGHFLWVSDQESSYDEFQAFSAGLSLCFSLPITTHLFAHISASSEKDRCPHRTVAELGIQGPRPFAQV
jgi:hypothetical protein